MSDISELVYLDVEQGTREWLEGRVGIITASEFETATSTLKNGDPSKAQLEYAAKLALERVSEEVIDISFQTPEMRRGRELEPEARLFYMERMNLAVVESGFLHTQDRWFGYSTDGTVDCPKDGRGNIEIKCPNSPYKIVQTWLKGDISEYFHQVQGGMWLTGARWCDLVIYDPRLRLVNKRMWRRRIFRDEAFIESMEAGLMKFRDLVMEYEAALRK